MASRSVGFALAVGGHVGGLGGVFGRGPLLLGGGEARAGVLEVEVGGLVGVVAVEHLALVGVRVFRLVVLAMAGAGGSGVGHVCEVERRVSWRDVGVSGDAQLVGAFLRLGRGCILSFLWGVGSARRMGMSFVSRIRC